MRAFYKRIVAAFMLAISLPFAAALRFKNSHPKQPYNNEGWRTAGGGLHGGPDEDDQPFGLDKFNALSPELQERVLEKVNEFVPEIAEAILKHEKVMDGIEAHESVVHHERSRRDLRSRKSKRMVPPQAPGEDGSEELVNMLDPLLNKDSQLHREMPNVTVEDRGNVNLGSCRPRWSPFAMILSALIFFLQSIL